MIKVGMQAEPSGFDASVRQKGLVWLRGKGIDLHRPLPPKSDIPPYWRGCLDELHSSYQGVCAYLAVYFERVMGGGSVDHFVAKSKRSDLAYEWSNYRLACSAMNSRKRDYDDVLDPFDIENGWFRLELVSGRIYSSPDLDTDQSDRVESTINRLGLDDEKNREMRARHYEEYCAGFYTASFLERRSPFVSAEAARQGML